MLLFRRSLLDHIQRLDPERDAHRIVYLDTFHEFPFDFARADELALFRTYAVPSIAALLDRTGEFVQRAQKRYDDTDLILSEIAEHGPDSPRGRAALRRMNGLHGRFPIPNDDFLYVLSCFVFEPPRWVERFGWRPMTEVERLGTFHYWRTVGRYMNITALPEGYDEFEAFNRAYERDHFGYTDAGRRVADATVDMFLAWFLPRPLRWLGRPVLYALLDDPLIEAFRFPRPRPALRRLVQRQLRLRSAVVRRLPERRSPRRRTAIRHRSYPRGYQIERLGPPPFSARS
jgi:hypothetical protein